MVIGKIVNHPRLGAMVPVSRYIESQHQHVHSYNLMIGDNRDVFHALENSKQYKLEVTTEAEWESFDAFELFPVLKLAMAR